MNFKSFEVHRKEQWDLDDVKPIICIHKKYDGGNGMRRIFCIGVSRGKLVYDFSSPFKYRY